MIMTAEKERKSNPKASNAEWSTKKLTKSKENPPPVRWKCLCLSQYVKAFVLPVKRRNKSFKGLILIVSFALTTVLFGSSSLSLPFF